MKKEEFTYTYVPDFITSAWSADGQSVRFLDKNGLTVSDCDYRGLYKEACSVDSSMDEISALNVFDEEKLKAGLMRVNEGDYSFLGTMTRDIASLASFLFYSNPFSPWRLSRIIADSEENGGKKKEDYDFLDSVYNKFMKHRSTDELAEALSMASFMAPYMYDLKPLFVEAPSGTGFALGYNPLRVMNFFDTDKSQDPSVSFFRNGVILFITLSPEYAVCLYDSFVYRPKKTDGRMILAPEEVENINRKIIIEGSNIVIRSRNEENESYYLDLMKDDEGKYDDESFILPSFRIIARAYEVQELETRIYPGFLNMYDMAGDKINAGERKKYIEKLLEGEKNAENI